MEKNFYRDNFEQLLKDSADNFRMYPSKRVWNSIYNDLHPSRRWPSVAVWLLFISALTFIGISNNNKPVFISKAAGKLSSTSGVQVITSATITKNSLTAALIKNETTLYGGTISGDVSTAANRVTETTDAQQTRPVRKLHASINENLQNNSNITVNKVSLENTRPAITIMAEETVDEKSGIALKNETTNEPALAALNNSGKTSEVKTDETVSTELKKKDLENLKHTTGDKNAEKEFMEDFAFHNKPVQSKWRSRASYQVYMTPSIGYRTVSKNNAFSPVINSSFISSSPATELNYDNAVSQARAVNMELGGTVLYNVSRLINLKIGIQFNYTNYHVNAYELKHPTVTTLNLNDINTGLPELSPRSTTLANASGVYSTKLNNNTYQVSLPLGADIRITGNGNLNWYAGATIQPTYIAGGNAYLISSDLKNYVTDNSLLRKWNLNGGIETFVSYKTRSGLILNAGPQLRYQLFSSYSKVYSYTEKLYNVGLKIGVSKRF